MNDRRKTRTLRTPDALRLLLEHAKRRLGVRALTLGTATGRLIAGAGDDPEQVAAIGANIDSGYASAPRIATWRFRVGATEFLLTSDGGAMDPDLGPGIRRILATAPAGG